MWLRLFLCGLCMGAADLVPGVSGGTVAFVGGIYEELLASIKSLNGKALKALFTLRFREFFQQVRWRFLLPLFGGSLSPFLYPTC